MSDSQMDEFVAFGLRYDGPALDAHQIDVRDLAPALLGAADLFREFGRIYSPSAPPVAVTVKANTEGSFVVELHILYELTKQMMLSPDVVATATLGNLVTMTTGVIQYFRKRHRTPAITEEPIAPGLTRITFADGTTIDLTYEALMATRDPAVQQALSALVRPCGRSRRHRRSADCTRRRSGRRGAEERRCGVCS